MSQVTPQSDNAAGSGWRWFPLNVGTALAFAVVVSLLAFLLTSDGQSPVAATDDVAQLVDNESPVVLAEPAPIDDSVGGTAVSPDEPEIEAAPPTTVAFAETMARDGGGDAAMASSSSILALSRDITNMGPTEVGFVTNFPSAEYTWERIEIAAAGQFDVGWLGELGGRIVAVSPTWEEGSEESGQRLVTSASTDGTNWAPTSLYEMPDGAWVSRMVSDGERIYVFAETWEEVPGESTHLLLTTRDGVSWSQTPLDFRAEPDEHVYIQSAAAGPAGVVVAVSYDSYPEEQPVLLDFGDLQVELDYMRSQYRLIDAASGDELMSGAIDDLFNWGAEGQRVYAPETGELLVTIPHEVWDQAYMYHYEGYGGGTPLPIPIYSPEPVSSPVITVEYDGVVVTVDDFEGEYSVADAESGDVIASGSLDYLYQGPPPLLIDPDSGEVLLSVNWDKWYAAEEQAYRYYETEHYDYESRVVLLTSISGESWAAQSIPTRNGGHVSHIVATDDGFVAMVNTYGQFGDQRSVWTMQDGVWSSVDSDHAEMWMYEISEVGDKLLGVGEGPGGMALWSSTNGIDWVSEFAVVPQDDGSYVSLTDVASDGVGTVGALAYREKWSEYEPLVIEKDGYTLTFDDGETALAVISSSGETVLVIGWYDGEESDQVSWEDGVTYIYLGNGDVVTITDEEAYAAMDERWADQGVVGLSVFLNDGGAWSEARVEVEGSLSGAQQLHLLDGKILIAGAYWGETEPHYFEVSGDRSFVVIVGTPVGG